MRFAIFAFFLLTIPAHADVWTFETPSQNIQCSVGVEQTFSDIICTIIERHGQPALPRPANCNADWGHTFSMNNTGAAEVLCVETNTSKGGFERAEYGVTEEFNDFSCHSSRKGLRCENQDGHGFFLSRATQTVF